MSGITTILEHIVGEVDAGRRVGWCVVVGTRGSTPQVPGAMACVSETGELVGTVGGGAGEAEVIRHARGLLAGGPSRLVTLDLDCEYGFGDGPICGGQMDVAIQVFSSQGQIQPVRETLDLLRAGHPAAVPLRVGTATGPVEYRLNLEPAPELLIAGAGHVGLALAHTMVRLGFRVSVIDDRDDFANAERFPPPMEPILGDIAETLTRRPIDAGTYVAIVTRGHRHDERALAAVLGSPAKYLGMIGSRRKIAVVFDNLRRGGATQEQLDRVHSPIGLPIKAVTPEEIAISIAAEMISVRRAEHRQPVEGPLAVADDTGRVGH
jgi:xanthine dehydrogenase accessory factor